MMCTYIPAMPVFKPHAETLCSLPIALAPITRSSTSTSHHPTNILKHSHDVSEEPHRHSISTPKLMDSYTLQEITCEYIYSPQIDSSSGSPPVRWSCISSPKILVTRYIHPRHIFGMNQGCGTLYFFIIYVKPSSILPNHQWSKTLASPFRTTLDVRSYWRILTGNKVKNRLPSYVVDYFSRTSSVFKFHLHSSVQAQHSQH